MKKALILLFLAVSIVFSCGYGMGFPERASADSIFFMTAIVTHIEEGDTIIEDTGQYQKLYDTVEIYDSISDTVKTVLYKLPSRLPRWNRAHRPKCTPVKVFIKPDDNAPLVPTDGELYLTFYGTGAHINSSPYRTNDTWRVGDRLFITTANWYEDSGTIAKQVRIPVYYDRDFCILKKFEEGDTTYTSLSPGGKLSVDSSIALMQLLIRVKQASDSKTRYEQLKEIQNWPNRYTLFFSDVTPFNRKHFCYFSFQTLVQNLLHKLDKVTRATLLYEYAKRWHKISDGVHRKSRDLELHLKYYNKGFNRYISNKFKKALNRAIYYIPIDRKKLDGEVLSILEKSIFSAPYFDDYFPLFLDLNHAKELFPHAKDFVAVTRSEIRHFWQQSKRFKQFVILYDHTRKIYCSKNAGLGKEFYRSSK